MPVIISPCTKESTALSTYSPNRSRRICPIRSKLMLPVPETLATRPLKSSVVAFPEILGPMMPNMVLPTAKISTATKAGQ